jgi:hypothetical protein
MTDGHLKNGLSHTESNMVYLMNLEGCVKTWWWPDFRACSWIWMEGKILQNAFRTAGVLAEIRNEDLQSTIHKCY